jgi:glycosyltransferase involved in cell wall biosynthesis
MASLMSEAPMRAGGPHYYTLAPDSNVGGEVYERELLRRLPAHGIDLVLGLPRDHRVDEIPPGWEVDVLRHRLGLHWTRAPLAFTPFVVGLLRHRRVDLLRGHSVRHTGPALLLGRAIARSTVPVVLHHHHLDPRWARLDAAIAGRADLVITVSEHARQELVAAGVSRERTRVVIEGVARPASAGVEAQGRWPAPGGLRLLYLGRLEARKRPEVALEALAGLVRRGISASLVIAGDGPAQADLKRRASAPGLNGAVRFAGRVSESEKFSLYDGADALLFPSTLEGFGLVVAEAQSRGLPVVAAAGTATVEAFDPGRSGLLADPSGDSFATALSGLADAEVRNRMAAEARSVADRFDWDRCAAEVADAYRAIARPQSTYS